MTKAFAPGNISCIFRIHKGETSETTGSTGVGFTINKGAAVTAEKSTQTKILFNGNEIAIDPVASIIKKLTNVPLKISILSELPLGGGFGLSGAATLATAYAINDLLNLQKEKLELARLSHIAEVENGTGLGDITNEYFRGFLLKIEPSFMFKVIKLPIDNIKIYCRFFSSLETKSVIQNSAIKEKIDKAGKTAIEKINALYKNKKITLENVITISKEFAVESGLLQNQEVIKTMQEIENNGGVASMIMLGNGVFSNIPFEHSLEFTIG
ncbi:MAG TPA: pantoate kinase [Patescibacteria group bacterium]